MLCFRKTPERSGTDGGSDKKEGKGDASFLSSFCLLLSLSYGFVDASLEVTP